MQPKQIDDILKQFADKTQFALELALRDAKLFGNGFVSVDKEGNVTYLDMEEASELAKKTLYENS